MSERSSNIDHGVRPDNSFETNEGGEDQHLNESESSDGMHRVALEQRREELSANIARDLKKIEEVRENLGAEPSAGPIHLQSEAGLTTIERALQKLREQDGRMAHHTERYAPPIPSVQEHGVGPYAHHVFSRFSPEQRVDIARNAALFNGKRFAVGDVVSLDGNTYEVTEVIPGGNIFIEEDYGADPTGNTMREMVSPTRLRLMSKDSATHEISADTVDIEASAEVLKRKTWLREEPLLKEVVPEGQPYGGKIFYRFSPEQRSRLAQQANLYEGESFAVGERVKVNGREWKVQQFVLGGQISAEPDYGADSAGSIWREYATPSRLELVDAEGHVMQFEEGKTPVIKSL